LLDEAINCFLRVGLVWKPYTVYQHVLELESAHYLVLNLSNLEYQIKAHFNILDHYHTPYSTKINFQASIEQLEHKLTKSIADRIAASDVEVGVFLSGGIDSNLIAAIAATMKKNIKTFTVKFDGCYDESGLAKLAAKKYQTNHIELNIANHLHHDIEKILLAYGEPFMDSSAIPSYYISQEARKHVKVVLSGDGADELFAGYRRYVPIAYQLMRYFKRIKHLLPFMPKPKTKQSAYNYFYRLLAMADKKNLDFYLSATADIFEDILPFAKNKIFTNLNQFIAQVFADDSLTALKKILYLDFSIILFGDLLVKMDIASMAHSLEVRSPFLSKYLLEFAPSLPDHFKINRLTTKYILRKLAEKYLPNELINQPKRGFEVPLKKWIDNDLREAIHDTLTPGCYADNFVTKKFIPQLLSKQCAIPEEKRAKILWTLYCLETWHKHEKECR
jgi:asparagine synthase (glutamine-hydrolysing)